LYTLLLIFVLKSFKKSEGRGELNSLVIKKIGIKNIKLLSLLTFCFKKISKMKRLKELTSIKKVEIT
jgi:hypothetical protein